MSTQPQPSRPMTLLAAPFEIPDAPAERSSACRVSVIGELEAKGRPNGRTFAHRQSVCALIASQTHAHRLEGFGDTGGDE